MTSRTGFIVMSCFVGRLSFIFPPHLKSVVRLYIQTRFVIRIQFHTLYCKICGMLYSLNCFVDPVSSGLIGILPDSTIGLLRFKCVLTLVAVSVMVSALKPD